MTYVLYRMESVRDAAKLAEYVAQVTPVVTKYGGKYLAVDPAVQVQEGEWPSVRTVIISFPTFADAQRWYDSPDYRAILHLRTGAADGPMAFVRGVDETTSGT